MLYQLGSKSDSAKETDVADSLAEARVVCPSLSTIMDHPMRRNTRLDEHIDESCANYKELRINWMAFTVAYHTFNHLRLLFVWMTWIDFLCVDLWFYVFGFMDVRLSWIFFGCFMDAFFSRWMFLNAFDLIFVPTCHI